MKSNFYTLKGSMKNAFSMKSMRELLSSHSAKGSKTNPSTITVSPSHDILDNGSHIHEKHNPSLSNSPLPSNLPKPSTSHSTASFSIGVDQHSMQNSIINAKQMTSDKSLKECRQLVHKSMWIWMYILRKSFFSISSLLLSMFAYYLPSLVLIPALLDKIQDLLYFKFCILIVLTFFFFFTSSYTMKAFGPTITSRVIFFFLLPSWIVLILLIFAVRQTGLVAFSTFLTVLIALFLIHIMKAPEQMSEKQKRYYRRKEDILVFVASSFLISATSTGILGFAFGFYLKISTLGKFFFRFFIVPSVVFFNSAINIQALHRVPQIHYDYCYPVICLGEGGLKIWVRLYTNSIFGADEYGSFIVLSLMACLSEILVHASFISRQKMMQSVMEKVKKMISNPKRRSTRSLSIIPRQSFASSDIPSASEPKTQDLTLIIRRKLLLEDICIDTRMIFNVTFLLYFIRKLNISDHFQVIPSLEHCLATLFIQLFFAFVSDVFAIYWVMRTQNTVYSKDDVINNRWDSLLMGYMFAQTYQISSWIMLYS